jgi:hypothetical protein
MEGPTGDCPVACEGFGGDADGIPGAWSLGKAEVPRVVQ